MREMKSRQDCGAWQRLMDLHFVRRGTDFTKVRFLHLAAQYPTLRPGYSGDFVPFPA